MNHFKIKNKRCFLNQAKYYITIIILFAVKNIAFSNDYNKSTIAYIFENKIMFVNESENLDTCISGSYNPFPQYLNHVGDSIILDAGSGHLKYNWSTGDTTRVINAKRSGKYYVSIASNIYCNYSDTFDLRLFKANILQRDTTICYSDSIRLDGVSGTYGSEIDIDGNKYNTKLFGNTIWFQSNLNSTKYSNGNIIKNILSENDWKLATSGAWANYQNDSIIGLEYGKLYNGYAVSDIRKVCPIGWKVPSENEWNYLSDYFGGDAYSAGKMKDSAIEFHAQLGGCRQCDWRSGSEFLRAYGFWWSSTPGRATGMNFYSTNLGPFGTFYPFIGFSVRCIKEDTKITKGLRYLWSTSDTTSFIYVNPKETTKYYFTVYDGEKISTDSIIVNVSVILDFNVFPDTIKSVNDSLQLDAGFGFSKYRWSTGDSMQRIYVKHSGWYNVSVANSLGCNAVDSVYVQFPDTIGLIIATSSAKCNTSVDVPIKMINFRNIISMKGSIRWRIPDLVLDKIVSYGSSTLGLSDVNFNLSQSASGIVSFSWTDVTKRGYTLHDTSLLVVFRFKALGSINQDVPLYFDDNPIGIQFVDTKDKIKDYKKTGGFVKISCDCFISAGPDQTACNSGAFTLAGNTPTTGAGQWSVISGTATITSPTSPTSTVTGIPAGSSATLRWTISNGSCSASTDDVVLTHRSPPVITITPASASIAPGGSVTITASGANTYTWSPATGLSAASGASVNASPSSTTTYTVSGTDAAGCVQAKEVTVTVSAVASPSVTLTGTLSPFVTCAGTPSATQTLTLSGSDLTADITLTAPAGYEISLQPTTGFSGTLTVSRSGSSVAPKTIYVRLAATASNGATGLITATTAMGSVGASVGSGLIAHLPFTGNTQDISGNGNNGTAIDATPTTDRFCNPAQAYQITEGRQLICTNQSFSSPGVLSYSVWIKSTSTAGGHIIGFNNGQCTHGGNWDRVLSVSSTGVDFYTFPGSSVNTTASANLLDGQWHHLAVTMDGSGTRLYVNGQLVKSNPAQHQAEGYTGYYRIGGLSPNDLNNSLIGSFDDLRIYHRVLTDQEIKYLASTSSVGTCIATVHTPPTTANAGADRSQCNNGSFTMQGNAPSVGTGQWSVVSGTATIVTPGSPTTVVTGIPVGGRATLRWTISNGSCLATTDDVELIHHASPLISVTPSAPSIAYGGSVTLTASGAVSYNWSPSTGLNATTGASVVATLTNNVTYTITGRDANGCEGTATVTVTVGSSPSLTVTGTLQSFSTCAGSPSAAQTLTVGGSNLSGDITVTAPTGFEISLASGSGYQSSLILSRSGTAVAATVIYIRLRTDAATGASGSLAVTSSGATAQSVAIAAATVHTPPTTANAGADRSQCNNGSFTMQGNTPITGSGQWSVVSGTATIVTPGSPTTVVTGIPAGGRATLRWTISNGSCPATTDEVELIHHASPAISVTPSAPSIAYGGSVTLTASGAVSYTWSPSTGLNATTGASVVATLTNNVTYTVTGRDANGCEGTATMTVTVGSSPSLAVTGTLQSFSTCAGSPSAAQTLTVGGANLSGDITVTAPTGFEISLASGSGYQSSLTLSRSGTAVAATVIYIRLRTDAATGASGSLAVTSSGASAQSVAIAAATVHTPPTTANAGADRSQCNNGSFTMQGNTPITGSGQWSVVIGTAVIANPSAPNTMVTGIPAGGRATLRWTISNGSCLATTDDVELIHHASPVISVTPAAPSIAYGGSLTLTASGAVSYTWSPSTGLNATTGASVVATLTNNVTYSVTGRDANGCEGTATVTVTVGPSPSLTVTGTLQSFSTCVGSPSAAQTLTVGGSNLSGDITVTAPTGFEISLASGAGFASSVTISRNGTSVASVPVYIRLSSSGRNGSAGNVIISSSLATPTLVATGASIVYESPTTSTAGGDRAQCNNGSFTTQGNAPTVGSGQWTVVSGTAVIANPSAPNTMVTGIPAGSRATLRWTISNGSCPATTDEVELVHHAPPTPAAAGNDLFNCGDGTFQLAANDPQIGVGSWSLVSGRADIALTSASGTKVSAVPVGSSAVLRWTIRAEGCDVSTDEVILTNRSMPDTSLTIPVNTTICSNLGDVMLSAGNAAAYQWIRDDALIAGAQARTYPARQSGRYRVRVTGPEGCSADSREVQVAILPSPVAAFDVNGTSQCLSVNRFQFSDRSVLSSGTFSLQWELGSDLRSELSNPIMTYRSAGTYMVKLRVISDRGCVDSVSRQIRVLEDPATPVILGVPGLCPQARDTLRADGSAPLSWYLAGSLIAGQTGTMLIVDKPGIYKAVRTNVSGCISESKPHTVLAYPAPEGRLEAPSLPVICEGTVTDLRASGAFAYQWYLNGAVLEGATSAGFAARLPGEYRVEFITEKGCRAMGVSGISLELIRKPTAEINYDLFCKGLPVNFTAQTNQGGNAALAWSWDMGDGSLRRSGRSISYIYDRPGTYEVRLTVTPTLCSSLSATYIRKIDIDSIAGPLRYPMVNAVIDKPTPLQARDIGAVWRWDPAIQLSSSVLRDPVFRGDRGQQYLITIRKPSGCVTVDTLQVRVVRESGIFVPAGFSPDNDGHNDRLFPHLVGIREMKRFRVFNRWGALVFDDRNANATTGWDGTFRGRPQPAESYAWVAEGVDFDGQVMIRTGNVVLIR